jgi:LPS-assembly protein
VGDAPAAPLSPQDGAAPASGSRIGSTTTHPGMIRFLHRPLALAIAAVFCAPAWAEPLGMPPLEVDPRLIAPPERPAPPAADTAPASASPRAATPASVPATPAQPAPEPSQAPAPPGSSAAEAPAAAPAPAGQPAAPAAAAPRAGEDRPAADGPPPARTPAEAQGPPGDTPVLLEADQLEGVGESEVRARGNAVLTQDDRSLAADQILFFPQSQDVYAEGNVVLRRGGDEARGPALNLNLESFVGRMEAPRYELAINDSRGAAEEVLFESRDRSRARNATFSTCPVDRPDWYARVGELSLDRSTNIGVARNATLVFKDVPILYTPWADFPLDGGRKTGFLPPVIGTTSQGGFDLTLPFYWNIAPNRDATVAPRYISRRGLMLNNEFRYLEPAYTGIAKADYLPNDNEADRDRYALLLQHTHTIAPRLTGGVNLQKVSDDNYFRDLANSVTLTSQAILPREGYLNYGGGWWSARALLQDWQTLQDPQAPVLPPYARLPQLFADARKTNLGLGLDGSVQVEGVAFDHPTLLTGNRYVAYPALSYPLQSSYAYLRPRAGVHLTHYDLDERPGSPESTSRGVPIFSVDSGMFFERDWEVFDRQMLQTLEPRIFYTYIPFRDQSNLPVFDSAEADFNFARLFQENRFIGNDRIGDANQLTLALTSRVLDPETADERFRVAVGQVLRFSDQRVQLFRPPSTQNRSDLLAGAGGRLSREWFLDSLFQWDPEDTEFEKLNLYGRYQPAPGKVLNLGYRYTREELEQVDISAQWPFASRWQALVRYNYSLRDDRLLDALAGFEYDAGCWSLRFVFQRIATSTQDTSNSFFLQLELTGLGRLGTDPISALRSSIPGFTEMDLYKEPPRRSRGCNGGL